LIFFPIVRNGFPSQCAHEKIDFCNRSHGRTTGLKNNFAAAVVFAGIESKISPGKAFNEKGSL